MLPLIVFLALFLLLLAALALAAIKLFGAKDAATGRVTAPGWFVGCATGCALAFIGLIGLVAFAGGVAAISALKTATEVRKQAEGVKIGVWRDGASKVHHAPGHALHVVLQWNGHSEPTKELLDNLTQSLGEMDILVNADYVNDDDGKPITVVDLALPAGDRDIDELEATLRSKLGDLKLSDGVQIELRDVTKGDGPKDGEKPRDVR